MSEEEGRVSGGSFSKLTGACGPRGRMVVALVTEVIDGRNRRAQSWISRLGDVDIVGGRG